jgi:two-component system OmpR family sensor kinase
MKSMRRWLLGWLIFGFVAASAVAGYAIFQTARAEAGELFDYELRAVGISLPQTVGESELAARPAPGLEGIEDDRIAIQTWTPDGQISYQSPPSVALPRMGDGYRTVEVRGRHWRVFGLTQPGRLVQVAQPVEVRNELAWKLAARTLWPLALLLPCAVLLVLFVVGLALRPVTTLSNAIGTRSAEALEPIEIRSGVPVEFVPLVKGVNDLLARLDVALRSQRTFVADAAHELRSPLTALKLQLQLAVRDGALHGNSELLTKIEERLNRTIHMVQQLLALAREDAGSYIPADMLDLREVALQVVGDASILAEQKQIDLGLEANSAAPLFVTGERAAISVLLANLVDNAIRYSRSGGKVDVSIGQQQGRSWIEVTDNGPGIAPEEMSRVFDRFYRGEGAAEQGSGLGLAIAGRIAQRHGAALAAVNRSPGPGLSVRVDFPETHAQPPMSPGATRKSR